MAQTKAEKRRRRIHASVSRVRDRRESRTVTGLRSGFYDALTEKVLTSFAKEKQVRVSFAASAVPSAWFKQAMNDELLPQLRSSVWSGVVWESSWIEQLAPPKDEEQALALTERQLTKGFEKPPRGFDVAVSDELMKEIRTHLQDRESSVWRFAAATTKTRIRRVMQRSLKEGYTLKDTEKAIRAELKRLKKWEAIRIARTETTASMQFGQHQLRADAGILEKEWISTRDTRTRSPANNSQFNHLLPNGQVQANSEAFELTGPRGTEYLLHPGDRSLGASAGNLINCRCASVAHII